jgi:hypothetical protein
MRSGRAAPLVSEIAIGTLHDADSVSRPFYEKALRNAFRLTDVPYGNAWFGNEFRWRARDQDWLASLIISDVDMEGYSAGRLWQYGVTIEQSSIADGMRRHAVDEARHSRMFAKMLFKVFPSLESDALKTKLRTYSPDLKSLAPRAPDSLAPPPGMEELLNSLMLINLFEIKSLILEKLLAPVLVAHAPGENRDYLGRNMSTIVADEVNHIRYSADILEEASRTGYADYIFDGLRDFQRVLNMVTERELEEDVSPVASAA